MAWADKVCLCACVCTCARLWKAAHHNVGWFQASFVRQPNKYDFMLRDYLAIASKKKSKWQYYVDDGVDGKPNGWYDYATEASDVVEGVHDTYLVNPANYNIRCVQSGHFMYQVPTRPEQRSDMTFV